MVKEDAALVRFGAIEGRIGLLEQLIPVDPRGAERDPDAQRDAVIGAVGGRTDKGALNAAAGGEHVLLRMVAEKDAEFVSAEPEGDPLPAVVQHLAQLLDVFVSPQVAVGVVDGLEFVQVQNGQSV